VCGDERCDDGGGAAAVFGKPLWINMIGHGVLREAFCTTVRF
jgi:hypothetical protein